jgi:hypothetical protein
MSAQNNVVEAISSAAPYSEEEYKFKKLVSNLLREM